MILYIYALQAEGHRFEPGSSHTNEIKHFKGLVFEVLFVLLIRTNQKTFFLYSLHRNYYCSTYCNLASAVKLESISIIFTNITQSRLLSITRKNIILQSYCNNCKLRVGNNGPKIKIQYCPFKKTVSLLWEYI